MTERCDGSGVVEPRRPEDEESGLLTARCPGCSACLKGRTLDERVATILGGPRTNPRWYWFRDSSPPDDLPDVRGTGREPLFAGPKFSSDPSACDEVKQWLREQDITFTIVHRTRIGDVFVCREHEGPYGIAPTEPEAVARFIARLNEEGLLKKEKGEPK